MVDLLLATVTVLVLLSVGGLALLGLTVVPFVLAGELADRRGASGAAWSGLVLLAVVIGAVGAYGVRAAGLPLPVVVVPLLLGWAAPAWLSVFPSSAGRLGSRGQHE